MLQAAKWGALVQILTMRWLAVTMRINHSLLCESIKSVWNWRVVFIQAYERLLGSRLTSLNGVSSGRSVGLLEKVVIHDIFERSVGLDAEKSHDSLPVTATAFGMSASIP